MHSKKAGNRIVSDSFILLDFGLVYRPGGGTRNLACQIRIEGRYFGARFPHLLPVIRFIEMKHKTMRDVAHISARSHAHTPIKLSSQIWVEGGERWRLFSGAPLAPGGIFMLNARAQ